MATCCVGHQESCFTSSAIVHNYTVNCLHLGNSFGSTLHLSNLQLFCRGLFQLSGHQKRQNALNPRKFTKNKSFGDEHSGVNVGSDFY
jgi:hypothetical protein